MKYDYIVWEINTNGTRVAIHTTAPNRFAANLIRAKLRTQLIRTEIEVIERKEPSK